MALIPILARVFKEVEGAAAKLDIQLLSVAVRGPADFEHAFAEMTHHRLDALITVADPLTFAHRKDITDFASKRNLPSYKFSKRAQGWQFPFRSQLDDQSSMGKVFCAGDNQGLYAFLRERRKHLSIFRSANWTSKRAFDQGHTCPLCGFLQVMRKPGLPKSFRGKKTYFDRVW
jgi:hypothetical protein